MNNEPDFQSLADAYNAATSSATERFAPLRKAMDNYIVRRDIAHNGGVVPTPEQAAWHAYGMIEGNVDGLVWDQTIWVEERNCGTACCVAGDVALQTGIAKPEEENEWGEPLVGPYSVAEAAQAILDLDCDQANYLFSDLRSKEEVLGCLKQIMDGTVPASDDDDAWNDDEWEDNGRP